MHDLKVLATQLSHTHDVDRGELAIEAATLAVMGLASISSNQHSNGTAGNGHGDAWGLQKQFAQDRISQLILAIELLNCEIHRLQGSDTKS